MIKRWYSIRINSEGYTTIRTLPLWYNVYRFLKRLLIRPKWRIVPSQNTLGELYRIGGLEFASIAGTMITKGQLIHIEDGKAYPSINEFPPPINMNSKCATVELSEQGNIGSDTTDYVNLKKDRPCFQ